MTPEVFLKNFLKEKIGKRKISSFDKIDLISEGVLDSLDIVTLSILIKRKYKVNLNINAEKTISIFRSYKKIINEIYKNEKK